MKLHHAQKSTSSYLLLAISSLFIEIQALPVGREISEWPALSRSSSAVKDLSTSSGLADKTPLSDAQQLHNAWRKPLTSEASWGQVGDSPLKTPMIDTTSRAEGTAAVDDGSKRNQAIDRLGGPPPQKTDDTPAGTGVFHRAAGRTKKAAAARQPAWFQPTTLRHINQWPNLYHLIQQHPHGAYLTDVVNQRIYWLDRRAQLLARSRSPHPRWDPEARFWENWSPSNPKPVGTGVYVKPSKTETAPLSVSPDDSDTFTWAGYKLPKDPFGLESIKNPQESHSTGDLGKMSSGDHNNPVHFHNLPSESQRAIQA